MLKIPDVDPIPLRTDQDGVIRIGRTRVTLETIIHAFNRGQTPDQIIYRFPAVKLADLYAVIAYYLRNRREVDDYVSQADSEAEQMRREAEVRNPDVIGLRERLLARIEEKSRQGA